MIARARAMLAAALLCAAAVAVAQDPGDAERPSTEAAVAVAPDPGDAERLSTERVGLFGRGVYVDGDEHKYREDYDDLQSGGGIELELDHQRGDGVYANAVGSFLFAEHGDDFDAAELTLAGGRWGRYHIKGDLSLLQSYFDDSLGGPLAGFPFTNALGRDLHTNRAHIDVEATALLGDRAALSVRYRHDDLDGDRSLLKGSITESFGPYAFLAPSSQGLDRRSDGVDVHAVLPAGPVQLALDGGYRREDSVMSTQEINYGSSAVRDRLTFRDAFDVNIYQGGISLAATEDPRIHGHGGYRLVYVDGEGRSSQGPGTATQAPQRATDYVTVDAWTHVGHAGAILRPVPGLSVRTSYALRNRDRNGKGTEDRRAATGSTSQQLRNRTDKDSMSHAPRVSATYAGLPRTRLRASYGYDRMERDVDWSSLTDGGGLAAIDRIQRTDEDIDRHKARLGARVRLTRRAAAEVGYDLLREEIDQTVRELVNEVVLGDRERDLDKAFAKVRVRASTRTSFDFGGEWTRSKFRRTEVEGDSSAKVEGYRLNAGINTQPVSGVSTQSTVSYVDRDYTVGEITPRTLSIFRDIEFRDRSVAGSVLASWAATPKLALRGRYSVATVTGSLDNVSHRAHVDLGYQATELLRIATGYSFLSFDEGLFPGDDFDGHFAWARIQLAFSPP